MLKGASSRGLQQSSVGQAAALQRPDIRWGPETPAHTHFYPSQDVGSQGKASTIFLPHSPAAVNDVSNQLRTGFLSAMAAEPGMKR